MKKLTLDLEQIAVSSFAVAEPVDAELMAFTEYTKCRCTQEAGCYYTKYCSGVGCFNTYQVDCQTNEQGAC
jgi:hypothetical protein